MGDIHLLASGVGGWPNGVKSHLNYTNSFLVSVYSLVQTFMTTKSNLMNSSYHSFNCFHLSSLPLVLSRSIKTPII